MIVILVDPRWLELDGPTRLDRRDAPSLHRATH